MPFFFTFLDFDILTQKWKLQKSTFLSKILKHVKSLSNWHTWALWTPILREKYQNLSPVAYGWKSVLLSGTPCRSPKSFSYIIFRASGSKYWFYWVTIVIFYWNWARKIVFCQKFQFWRKMIAAPPRAKHLQQFCCLWQTKQTKEYS